MKKKTEVKREIIQTGIHYPSLKPYYQVQEFCSNCGKIIRIVEGEVKKEKDA